MSKDPISYKDSGVDIETGYEVVRRIKGHCAATFRPEVLAGIGSFGSFFAMDKNKYEEPVLVSGTDGVGTKLRIAFMTGKHDTIGLDVVAYCINDIICQGAEPLFFLDYLGCGKVYPEVIEQIVKGVAEGCKQAGCSLVGGETAEMPGFYPEGEYDLAGFAVGVVDRPKVIDGSKVAPGDAVIGIASTGLQSSGFSLVRKVFFEVAKMSVSDYVPEFGRILGEELLEPTRIYAKQILELISKFNIKGIANISGGGLPENLPRSIADGTRVVIRKGSWDILPVFSYLQNLGGIAESEMYKTFNMGIGMALIVSEPDAEAVVAALGSMGEKGSVIGYIEAGERGLRFE